MNSEPRRPCIGAAIRRWLRALCAVPGAVDAAIVVPRRRRHFRSEPRFHARPSTITGHCGPGCFPARSATASLSASLPRLSRCCSASRPPMRCRAAVSGRAARSHCGSWRRGWRRRSPSRSRSFSPIALLGLIDSLVGLVVIYLTFNLALVVWMMRNFFDGVPRALEEAAWIDGCGVWSGFRLIALPLAAPGLAATGVLCFIFRGTIFSMR